MFKALRQKIVDGGGEMRGNRAAALLVAAMVLSTAPVSLMAAESKTLASSTAVQSAVGIIVKSSPIFGTPKTIVSYEEVCRSVDRQIAKKGESAVGGSIAETLTSLAAGAAAAAFVHQTGIGGGNANTVWKIIAGTGAAVAVKENLEKSRSTEDVYERTQKCEKIPVKTTEAEVVGHNVDLLVTNSNGEQRFVTGVVIKGETLPKDGRVELEETVSSTVRIKG